MTSDRQVFYYCKYLMRGSWKKRKYISINDCTFLNWILLIRIENEESKQFFRHDSTDLKVWLIWTQKLNNNRGVINGKAGKAAALPKFSDTLTLSQSRGADYAQPLDLPHLNCFRDYAPEQ